MKDSRLSLYLARRLSLSSGGRKSSPGVGVATAAVALSVAVMMAAVAIVMGFKQQITEKVTGFNSDITVSVMRAEGDDYLTTLTPSLREVLDSMPFITDYSLQVAAPAVMKTPDDFKGVYIKSLAGRRLTDFLASSVDEGKMPDYSSEKGDSLILISRIAADRLGLKAGDRVDMYFITDNIRVRRLTVEGIYNSHFDAYDDVYVYSSPGLTREISGLSPTQGTTLSVSTADFGNIEEDTHTLSSALLEAVMDGRLYKPYKVENARTSGANFFHWLDLLDMNVAVVLVLMTLVACVTLVSGMLIIIADKQRFIALMKSLGAGNALLRKVFVYLALRVALVGLLIGDAIGLTILYIQKYTHFIPLDPDSYYIDFVPVYISWPAVAILNIAVLLIAWIVLILPARFVGRTSPARSLVRN